MPVMVRALRYSVVVHLVVDAVGDDRDRRGPDVHPRRQEARLLRVHRNDQAFLRRLPHPDVGRQNHRLRRRHLDASQQSRPCEVLMDRQYRCVAETRHFVVHPDHSCLVDLLETRRVHGEVALGHQDQAVGESADRWLNEAGHQVAEESGALSMTSGAAAAL